MKTHNTDYVLINTKTNLPIEEMNDVIYGDDESVRWFLYEGYYDEEEIDEIIEKLRVDGTAVIDSVFDWSLISMTKLPIEIQNKYIETLKQTL
jgi:hypothetical protein